MQRGEAFVQADAAEQRKTNRQIVEVTLIGAEKRHAGYPKDDDGNQHARRPQQVERVFFCLSEPEKNKTNTGNCQRIADGAVDFKNGIFHFQYPPTYLKLQVL